MKILGREMAWEYKSGQMVLCMKGSGKRIKLMAGEG